ncbi:MAG: hypothetical protein GY830_10715 [Bacteroidetes bacterium]|nr:hypothetical protein [Bacteroidota bacterium]
MGTINQKSVKSILVLFGTNRNNSLTEQVGNYYIKLLNKHRRRCKSLAYL